ncbi:MAG: TolC family protein [Candidatus Krumholzibacteriia bacterium]
MHPTHPDRRRAQAAVWLLAALCATATAAPQPGPAPLDLPTVLELVTSESATAAAAAADQAAAAAAVDRARAGWWPSVDLAAQYTLRDHRIEAEAGTLTFPTAPQNNGQYALEARELVWDGGRRSLAIEAAGKQAQTIRLGNRSALTSAQLAAAGAYLDALELAASRRVIERRLDALSSHLKVARDLLDQGLTARNDVLETEVRVRAVENQLAAVDDRQATAAQDLNRRLGRDPATVLALPDSLATPPALPDHDALLAAAVTQNPGLQTVASRLDQSRTNLELARKAWYPSVFVGAAHAYVQNEYLVHQFINSVVAGVTWNILDGGTRKADIRQAEARTAQAARDRLEVERSVTVAVDDAWRRWEQARRELATARIDVAAARENLRIVEDQYQQGLARSSDVLDAEALFAQSQYDVVRRHYATYRTQMQLLTAAGQDLVAFYRGTADSPRED